jgi:hypothetical protein
MPAFATAYVGLSAFTAAPPTSPAAADATTNGQRSTTVDVDRSEVKRRVTGTTPICRINSYRPTIGGA